MRVVLIDVKLNEAFRVGDAVVRVLKRRSGQNVSLVIWADEKVKIDRKAEWPEELNEIGMKVREGIETKK